MVIHLAKFTIINLTNRGGQPPQGTEMKQKKDTYIKVDNKKQRDSDGKILWYTYEDAKRIYKGLRAKGIDATCGSPIYLPW